MFESRAQAGDVCVLERVLEHVQDDRVRSISDGVNVLKKTELSYTKRGSISPD